MHGSMDTTTRLSGTGLFHNLLAFIRTDHNLFDGAIFDGKGNFGEKLSL